VTCDEGLEPETKPWPRTTPTNQESKRQVIKSGGYDTTGNIRIQCQGDGLAFAYIHPISDIQAQILSSSGSICIIYSVCYMHPRICSYRDSRWMINKSVALFSAE
jgi:hypothetical protein